MLPVALKPWAAISTVKFVGGEFWECESATVTVIGKVPVALDVPESVPSVDKFSPGGSAPVSLQAYGGYPPVAVNAKLKFRLIAPTGRDAVVIVSGAWNI